MSAPNPREIQEFQFQLLSRLRIFYDDCPLPINESLSLVAAASKYGLVFVGCLEGLRVIQIQKIVDLYAHEKKKPSETSDYPSRIISLPTQPTHLDINCDNQYLAVSHVEDDSSIIEIYDIPSFTSEEESIALELRPSKRVSSLSWNPGNNAMLAVCLVDGSAVIYDLKSNMLNISSIPPEAHATCLCWSPKGKQIVVGSAIGTINQFKPDFKVVKSIPSPPSQNPLSVVSVQWLSNFQFAAVYKDTSDANKPVTALYIINTPKVGPMTYINYDDICFSTSFCRPPQYYITHQQNWNVLLVASGTSMELGVLGQQADFWEQWIQEDQFRAELPLRAAKKEETFPVGMALDTSVQYNLPIGENQSLPPMPLLLLLSDEGLLSLFFVVNILPSAANICSPPTPLPDQCGLHHFKFPSKDVREEQDVKPAPTALVTPTILNQPQLHSFDITQTATQVQAQTTQPETPPQLSWLGQAQTSGMPNWVSAATPTVTLTIPSSPSSSLKGFLAATSTSASPATSAGPFSGSKLTQSFVLPGTQVTITPVASSSGAVSQPAAPTSTPLVLPMYSIPSVPQQTSTSTKFTTNIPQTEVKTSEPTTPQLTDLSPVKSDEASELTKEEPPVNNDAVILSAINEEIAIFNSEIEDMSIRRSKINIFIGTEEQKTEIEQQMQSLESFFQELKEITAAQKAEVHSLKNSLFEAFSWVEDAKSQLEQYKNPYFMKLVKSRDLDPVTARKISSVESMIYYIERQVSQANKLLDSLSCNLQSKLPKNTIKVPSLETVYQTLIILNNIRQNQAIIVDDIEEKLKASRKRANRISRISDLTFNQSKDSESNELSKLAENFLKIKLGKSSETYLNETENESVVDTSPKKLSDIKKGAVFKALCERPVPLIKSPSVAKLPGKISDSSSLSTLLSSLPSSGAKPGGISSGKPIFSSSTPKQSMSVAQAQNKVNVKLPNMVSTEISGNDNLARTQVLGVVKSNLVPSCNLETPVKPSIVTVPKLFQTNMYGNKENKPTTTVTFATQPTVSNSQTQSKLPSFTVTDKTPNKEVSFVKEPNTEFSNPTSSMSIPFTLKNASSNSNIVSSANNDSSTNAKSPLSSLTNMVSGFVETSPKISTEKPTPLKTSTNQPFQFSFPIADTNKTSQSAVSTTPKTSTTSTTSKTTTASATDDSVSSKNLFGGITNTQNISNAEPMISNSVFSGNSKTNKSLFGGDTTTKNIFGGDSTAKSVFGADLVTPKSIFGGDSTTNKNLFSSNTSSISKNVIESETAKSKSVFSSEPNASSVFDREISSTSIFDNNSIATKPSSTTESKSLTATTDLSSSINKPSDIVNSSTTTQKNISGLGKSSPVNSTPGSPKSGVVGSEISSSQKTVFGEEPTISKTETTSVDSTLVESQVEDSSQVESSSSSFGVVSSDKPSSPKSVLVVVPTIVEPSTEKKIDLTTTTTIKSYDSLQEESSPSLFGSLNLGPASSVSQTKPSSNIFGGSSGTFRVSSVETTSAETTPKETESSGPAFGVSSSATAAASSFNFGVAGASIFGNQSKPEATPAATSSPAKTDSTLSFGQLAVSTTEAPPSTSVSVTSPSVAAFSFTLPQSTTTPTTSTFSFAQAGTISSTTTDDKNSKISLTFGQTPVTTTNSIFGGFNTQPVTTGSSSSIFGAPPASSAPQSSFTFALSGTTAAQNSFFGNTSNAFGSTPATTSSSFFGSSTTTSSVFGQPSVTTPVFGQVATSQTTSPFGSNSGFGAKPTFGQSGGSLFGQSSSGGFGSGSGGTSMFGGGGSLFGSGSSSGSNPFQSSGTGSLFGGGGGTTTGRSFSSGGQSVSETGFGSPASFQNKIGGFGASPTFGGSPPAFGSAPTFGGAPAFGSPNKMFGSTSPNAAFGSNTQQSPGFESLASQNTMTFGNLAQNQPGSFGSGSIFGGAAQTPQQQTGFSNANSSFSGSSFSSWR